MPSHDLSKSLNRGWTSSKKFDSWVEFAQWNLSVYFKPEDCMQLANLIAKLEQNCTVKYEPRAKQTLVEAKQTIIIAQCTLQKNVGGDLRLSKSVVSGESINVEV